MGWDLRFRLSGGIAIEDSTAGKVETPRKTSRPTDPFVSSHSAAHSCNRPARMVRLYDRLLYAGLTTKNDENEKNSLKLGS